MHLYALDERGEVVPAVRALKQTPYYCPECRSFVHVRGGPHRRRHFYHVDPDPSCRQHQKGPIHLHLQAHFLRQLPAGDCQLERPFPSIRRIADVAWLSQKLLFEIQCSPISAEEVLSRNHDYLQEGWRTIWILHDQRYNQTRLSAAEIALRSSPHFFSNMNHAGNGLIYDQFDLCDKGFRFARLAPLPIDFREPPAAPKLQDQPYPLLLLTQRASQWPCSFQGDLMSLFECDPLSPYLQEAAEREAQFYPAPTPPLRWRQLPIRVWQRGIAIAYRRAFHFLLEKMCR